MRLIFAIALLAASQGVAAFVSVGPTRWGSYIAKTALQSTVETQKSSAVAVAHVDIEQSATPNIESTLESFKSLNSDIVPLTEAEINARLGMQMEKLQAKDRTSIQLSKEVSDGPVR